jgi:hypothetical protein
MLHFGRFFSTFSGPPVSAKRRFVHTESVLTTFEHFSQALLQKALRLLFIVLILFDRKNNQTKSGIEVMILKIFSPKNWAKFFTQKPASLCKNRS